MQYDEEIILTRYIWDHYRQLMTDFERAVGKAIIGREKAQHTDDPQMAQWLYQRLGNIDQEEINEALKNGHETFRTMVKDRLIEAYREQMVINRCPVCRRIVRTPEAKLCTWCGHAWHPKKED